MHLPLLIQAENNITGQDLPPEGRIGVLLTPQIGLSSVYQLPCRSFSLKSTRSPGKFGRFLCAEGKDYQELRIRAARARQGFFSDFSVLTYAPFFRVALEADWNMFCVSGYSSITPGLAGNEG